MYLSLEQNSVFTAVTELQSFASSLAFKTVRPPRACWDREFTRVAIDKEILHLTKMRSGFRAMYDDAIRRLLDLTGRTDLEFKVTSDIQDSLSDATHGVSFLDDPRFQGAHNSVFRRFIEEPRWRVCTTDNEGNVIWNRAGIQRVYFDCEELVKLISTLVHTIPGLPARATEYSDTKIRNGAGRVRNLYFMLDNLYKIGMYTKTSNVMEHDSYIPSLFPTELRDLIVEYLVKVRPVEVLLWRVLGDEVAAYETNTYLLVCCGTKMTSDDVSSTLRKHTAEYMGASLGINAWRHLSVAVQREFIPSHFLTGGDRTTDSAANHSTEVARGWYGVLTDSLPRLTTDAMWEFNFLDRLWHDIVGFGENAPPAPIRLTYKAPSSIQFPTGGTQHCGGSGITLADINNVCSAAMQRFKEDLRIQRQEDMKEAAAMALSYLKPGSGTTNGESSPSFDVEATLASMREMCKETLVQMKAELRADRVEDMKSAISMVVRSVVDLDGLRQNSRRPQPASDDELRILVPDSESPPPLSQSQSWSPVRRSTELGALPKSVAAHSFDLSPSSPASSSSRPLLEGRSHELLTDTPAPPASRLFSDSVDPILVSRQPGDSVVEPFSPQESPPVRPTTTTTLGIRHYDRYSDCSSSSSLTNADVAQHALHLLYGSGAQFKSPAQRDLVERSMSLDTNFVYIIKTGGGKSLAWEAPAIFETDVVTAVVVPFRSLLNQHLETALSRGIKAAKWTAAETCPDSVRLLFLACESADCVSFGRYVTHRERCVVLETIVKFRCLSQIPRDRSWEAPETPGFRRGSRVSWEEHPAKLRSTARHRERTSDPKDFPDRNASSVSGETTLEEDPSSQQHPDLSFPHRSTGARPSHHNRPSSRQAGDGRRREPRQRVDHDLALGRTNRHLHPHHRRSGQIVRASQMRRSSQRPPRTREHAGVQPVHVDVGSNAGHGRDRRPHRGSQRESQIRHRAAFGIWRSELRTRVGTWRKDGRAMRCVLPS